MNFTEFGFTPAIVAAIKQCGYNTPTDIQQQAMPHLMQGRDLLGLAQTGTGKTAAFVLPTLQRIADKAGKKVKALILPRPENFRNRSMRIFKCWAGRPFTKLYALRRSE